LTRILFITLICLQRQSHRLQDYYLSRYITSIELSSIKCKIIIKIMNSITLTLKHFSLIQLILIDLKMLFIPDMANLWIKLIETLQMLQIY